ncbi:MAG: MOSC domain-containing protein [Phycisphaerae bacterium]|nr:MOSC domain-containing protein [Phycisphaerae bacterium]
MTGALVSIQIGRAQTYRLWSEDGAETARRTGFGKTPTLFPVRVFRTHIEGDEQANLKFHGGIDAPILAYCAEHYPRWQAELGTPGMGPGAFGENFTISGLSGAIDETTVCIGDRFRIGDLIAEVSQPREPCSTLTSWWKMPELARLVVERNRGGWYLRVIEEGTVKTGDAVERIAQPYPQWTIAAAMRTRLHGKRTDPQTRNLYDCPALSTRWKIHMAKRLGETMQ